jgi:hypothetical protein
VVSPDRAEYRKAGAKPHRVTSATPPLIDRLRDAIVRTWIVVTTQSVIARFAPLLRKQKGMSEKSSNEAVEGLGDDVQYLVESQITLQKLYLLKNLDLPFYTHDYTIFRWRRETGKIVLQEEWPDQQERS